MLVRVGGDDAGQNAGDGRVVDQFLGRTGQRVALVEWQRFGFVLELVDVFPHGFQQAFFEDAGQQQPALQVIEELLLVGHGLGLGAGGNDAHGFILPLTGREGSAKLRPVRPENQAQRREHGKSNHLKNWKTFSRD